MLRVDSSSIHQRGRLSEAAHATKMKDAIRPPRMASGILMLTWQDLSALQHACMGAHAMADARKHACSNANPRDFGGADSPPWSPRRVPPAHLWGEGPPRYPGYRSGGATLSDPPEGIISADPAVF